MNPVELSNCALWVEAPKWLAHFTETSEGEFDSVHVPEECLAEVRADEKGKRQRETSSLLLAAAEPCGIAQIIRSDDFSNLQRLLRVTTLILKFVRIMKLLLKRDAQSRDESTTQLIAVPETLWIKEVKKSLSKHPKFETWRKQFGIFTDHQGITRCTGRLAEAELSTSRRSA